ncbi:MAG: DNA-processing protein DprA [Acidobacteriota bacterium]
MIFERTEIISVALQILFSTNSSILRKLKEREITPEEIFSMDQRELSEIGMKESNQELILTGKIFKIAEEELYNAEKIGARVISYDDENFPPLLREIQDPPRCLYIKGDSDLLKIPSIAIVGTRNFSPYGKNVAERISSDLAERGLVVVSGLARGIDSIAHKAAIGKGKTIGVLGCGIDIVYPKENKSLMVELEKKGVVISEFPLGTPPFSQNFPVRNRTISGISYGVVVIEASIRSGSLITAGYALDQGREVMAVPGNITSELSRGTNFLIKSGAKLVETWEDVVEELPHRIREQFLIKKEKIEIELTQDESKIFEILKSDEATPIDEISVKTGIPVFILHSHLLNLELKGAIIQNPGKTFQKKLL